MDRRKFIGMSALSSLGLLAPQLNARSKDTNSYKNRIKPISGSWFEFQHSNLSEGEYWNPALASFTAAQWREKVYETSTIGFKYLVIQQVALRGKTYYPSNIFPQYKLGCEDPLEAVLSAADEFGLKVFIGNGYWGDDHKGEILMSDPKYGKLRIRALEEIVKKYGHHPCLFGWYLPNESWLSPYFRDVFVNYVNEYTKITKQLTPSYVNLIAPYDVKNAVDDHKFVEQLENLNVDIIAYQDGVGVNSTRLEDDGKYFKILYEAHQKAGRSKIWADMEIFYFEDKTKGNLLPADFSRIYKQMKAISPFVEKILCYEYIGQMNMPNTIAYAGNSDYESVRLYIQYKNWYDKHILNK